MATVRTSLRIGDAPQQLQFRSFSTAAPLTTRRLNKAIDFSATPLLYHTAETFKSTPGLPRTGPSSRENLFQSVNSSLRTALKTDQKVVCFGEDVAFGGVFSCTMGLQAEFGPNRIFNTPITEQGIVGVAVAFDQIVNEAAKFRYREGATGGNLGGMVIRMPCGGVGHGALTCRYHTQSPESLFCHIPGFKVVVPRSPSQAKGLLLASILESSDPVIFMEPKILYRAAVEHVPEEMYTLPLSQAEIVKSGKDLTIISYGRPLYTCAAAIEAAERDFKGASIELIDLRTIYPWDRQTVAESAKKTGRAIIVHESMVNFGVGAEVAATIQRLAYEKFIVPDVAKRSLEY
ncbi:related to 3-methyl-2-oxobutanoate dehydrogenase [Phialocephala subalpina]|uniref:3-methyl-2-oxobutanoate dehydrogenase (2-methylpropanoyl-transferring) n=1 Tax=Phialocephala subalpina TaxID=576137 RepID=A0A1L7XYJ2_9HELO|nr:related to 3-methyl-2-oxobutanoate dehydrogenase [Phialocephala subalpina]